MKMFGPHIFNRSMDIKNPTASIVFVDYEITLCKIGYISTITIIDIILLYIKASDSYVVIVIIFIF